jgi:hypothetical protein
MRDNREYEISSTLTSEEPTRVEWQISFRSDMMHKRYTSKNFFVKNVDPVYAEHRKIGKATRMLRTVYDIDFS